ncbi:MAG: alpha/beta hydrolase [Pacificimonas sp.]
MIPRVFIVFLFLIAHATASQAQDYRYEVRQTIKTVDERDLSYYLDHPVDDARVPLLLLVDGSGCSGQLRPGSRFDYRPGPDSPKPYARLMVEKPGVEPEAPHESDCSDDFHKYYAIDKRVMDHLRVLQHLRATADWWNGDLLVWGWSDGGDIAAQLVSIYPDASRPVLGAMGGGITMAEQFEDIWACPEADMSAPERMECLADLRKDFANIRDNPGWRERWNGESHVIWNSRLWSRLSALLVNRTQPFLIVHGAMDRENTPIESARRLVADLESGGNTAFTYWEVPDMAHGWSDFPPERKASFKQAMLNWLLDVPAGEGGPPDFGKSSAAQE